MFIILKNPHKPIAISFPPSKASEFAKDIDKLIEDFSVSLPALVDSDEYKAGLSIIKEKYKQRKEEYIRLLQKKAKGKSQFSLLLCRSAWSLLRSKTAKS